MGSWSPQHYRVEAAKRGLSKVTVEAALAQAKAVQRRQLPAILTLKHLSFETGVSYVFLRSVVSRKIDPYRTFPITKRSGGKRYISVPDRRLLTVQRWLSDHVLSKQPPHSASMAYAPGCSPMKCALVHVGCRWLIKIDIQQFFESISEIQAYRVFRGLGYGALVAFELGRLATRVGGSRLRREASVWRVHNGEDRYSIDPYRSAMLGYLPQGAATSPMLANHAMAQFADRVASIADKAGMSYTRYSDDLALSTVSEDFGRTNARDLIREIYSTMRQYGLRPRTAKTVVAPPGARRLVLGVLVDSSRPRLSHAFRSRLECHVHFIARFGPAAHAQTRGFRTVSALRRHVFGLLAHAESIDPAFAAPLRAEVERVLWPL